MTYSYFRTPLAWMISVIVCLATVSIAVAMQYSITDLGTLGGSRSSATAINSDGKVAGYAERNNPINHGFLYDEGLKTDLGVLSDGVWGVVPSGINDSAQIVG